MNRWSDADAQRCLETYADDGEDTALRVYTTRLLGSDPTLVLHGGGNTSVKTTARDELGRDVAVLRVKGSGWDMGSIEPAGLPAVQLAPLRELRALDRLSDEAMVNCARRCLMDASAPNPSVETLLHAFLPHKFIDHTHADAVLALADQPDAEALCHELYGDRFGLVPYIMPGFALAKKAAEVYEQRPDVEGLILLRHGVFSFGETARSAYERMIDAVAIAEQFLAQRSRDFVWLADSKPVERPECFADCLAALRGAWGERSDGPGRMILQWRRTDQIDAFLARPDLADIATRGTATPDHVIRTKQKPLIIERPDLENAAAFREQVAGALTDYARDYRAYFQRQAAAKAVDKTMVHPLPLAALVPGLGLIAAGKDAKAANIVADIYEHTIDVILKAESVGRYSPLAEDDLFDMEYWSLEQAKLGKKKPPAMAGHVALVTGAAGGIGRAVARELARDGAALVLTDLREGPLAELAAELKGEFKTPTALLACDLADAQAAPALVRLAARSFGGLDLVVSNAGKADTGPIAEAGAQLRDSLQINLLAHQNLAAAAAEFMKRQGLGGCLLFNASKSAFNPGPDFGAYSVAKAGLIALMKQYAVEYAPHGVRSMAVNADRIRTALFSEELLAARAAARGLTPEAYFKANLLGAEVTAEDVARAFHALYRAEKTTAAVFPVDGGNIAASPR